MSPQHRLLKALRREPVDKTPIWIMRQAGRYLPEYRQMRIKAKNFMHLCKTPELACEATLQPIRRFPLDAAIIFSDILTIPDSMGLGLHFIENEGPRFEHPITSMADINALPIPDTHLELHYVIEAIRLVKHELDDKLPLIGFAGSPWTLATYMIEGGASKSFNVIKKWLFQEPRSLHKLLEKLTIAVTNYLRAQIEAGADAVMLFDTWGGILTPDDYQLFSLNYMTKIIANIQQQFAENIPIILFTKNGGQWLETIANSGANALGLDWTIPIGKARQQVGHKVALQGNMDPATLYASPTRIAMEAKRILTDYGKLPGHIFNLGHGILPDTPIESVSALVDAVHQFQHTTPVSAL